MVVDFCKAPVRFPCRSWLEGNLDDFMLSLNTGDLAMRIATPTFISQAMRQAITAREWEFRVEPLGLHAMTDCDAGLISLASTSLDSVLSLLIDEPAYPILVLDPSMSLENGKLILRAGGAGYYSDQLSIADCVHALEVVASGELWASRAILHSLIRGMLEIESPHRNFPMRALSPREIEVARYVAAGLPNKRIALRMDVTERTVKAHLSSIFQKTDASDRLELALLMRGELPERIRINLQ